MNNSDQNQPQAADENLETPKTPSKKVWVAPKIETIEFANTDASFVSIGGADAGFYSST